MTRPFDIRDLTPRDAVLGDKRLGTDADDNLAMTNQPDNSANGTAASRNVGTAEDQIPLNSDLPASAKSGDYNDLNNLPTLGTAAAKNTGLNTGDVLTPEDVGLNSGETNWTSGNMQPEESIGLLVSRTMKNISGGTIAANTIVAGSQLNNIKFDSAGNLVALGTVSGSWKNTSGGGVVANECREFTRTAL